MLYRRAQNMPGKIFRWPMRNSENKAGQTDMG
jgi:hypothetical protein